MGYDPYAEGVPLEYMAQNVRPRVRRNNVFKGMYNMYAQGTSPQYVAQNPDNFGGRNQGRPQAKQRAASPLSGLAHSGCGRQVGSAPGAAGGWQGSFGNGPAPSAYVPQNGGMIQLRDNTPKPWEEFMTDADKKKWMAFQAQKNRDARERQMAEYFQKPINIDQNRYYDPATNTFK